MSNEVQGVGKGRIERRARLSRLLRPFGSAWGSRLVWQSYRRRRPIIEGSVSATSTRRGNESRRIEGG